MRISEAHRLSYNGREWRELSITDRTEQTDGGGGGGGGGC